MKLKTISFFSCLSLLSGCMVGPNYHRPDPEMPITYHEDRMGVLDPYDDENLAHWWTLFNDPFLDALLEETIMGSFDWKIALENICQARAAYTMQRASLFPEIDSDMAITRSRTSQTLAGNALLKFPPIQNFYQTGLDAIWQIDIFGGLRRATRAAYDTWEATIEEARGVRITLLSDTATIYTNICALQQTREIFIEKVELDEALVLLQEDLFQAGLADETQLQTTIATLERDRAALLALDITLRQTIYSLAILLGRPPETLVQQFETTRPIPFAIGRIPVGLPSDLLRRRPDIRAAERQLAAATEEIGVAVANLFPQVSLTGSSASFSSNPLQGANYGYASNSFSKWFTAPSRIWGLGGLVSWVIWDFDKRLAMVAQQTSIQRQTLLNYEKTVITALQEVESALVAYFDEELRLESLTVETEANKRIFDLISDRFQAGLADLGQMLTAQEVWLVSWSNQIASEGALTRDLIALYTALGGGWECLYTP